MIFFSRIRNKSPTGVLAGCVPQCRYSDSELKIGISILKVLKMSSIYKDAGVNGFVAARNFGADRYSLLLMEARDRIGVPAHRYNAGGSWAGRGHFGQQVEQVAGRIDISLFVERE